MPAFARALMQGWRLGPASESLQGRKPRVGEALAARAPAYGDLAIGGAAAGGVGGVFSRRARAAVPFGTFGSTSNVGSAARRDARSAAHIDFGANGDRPSAVEIRVAVAHTR